MTLRPQAARVFFRVLASVTFLSALTFLLFTFRGGPAELLIGLVLAAIYATIGIGLWRVRPWAWTVALLANTLSAALTLPTALRTFDLMTLSMGGISIGLVAGLIWAGRQLPEADDAAPSADPTSPS